MGSQGWKRMWCDDQKPTSTLGERLFAREMVVLFSVFIPKMTAFLFLVDYMPISQRLIQTSTRHQDSGATRCFPRSSSNQGRLAIYKFKAAQAIALFSLFGIVA
jgi:hypothetical protein